MNKYLVLFDIDGTILELKRGTSRQIFSEIINEVFSIESNWQKMPDFAGKTDLQILHEICDLYNLPYDDILKRIDSIWLDMYKKFKKYCTPEHILLLPGVKELIEIFDDTERFTLGILTGNFKLNAELKLSVYDINRYFPFGAFGSDNNDRNKLAGIAIERANSKYGAASFSNENTIIIGDSPRDIECAKVNDAISIAVATGSFSYETLSANNPDLLFHNFANYTRVFREIESFLG